MIMVYFYNSNGTGNIVNKDDSIIAVNDRYDHDDNHDDNGNYDNPKHMAKRNGMILRGYVN